MPSQALRPLRDRPQRAGRPVILADAARHLAIAARPWCRSDPPPATIAARVDESTKSNLSVVHCTRTFIPGLWMPELLTHHAGRYSVNRPCLDYRSSRSTPTFAALERVVHRDPSRGIASARRDAISGKLKATP